MRHSRLPSDGLEYVVLSGPRRLGIATVQQLHGTVGALEGLVCTTIAKVVDRLREKDLIQRRRARNAFWYRSRVRSATVKRARAHEIIGRLLCCNPRGALATPVDAMDSFYPRLPVKLEMEIAVRRRAGHGV